MKKNKHGCTGKNLLTDFITPSSPHINKPKEIMSQGLNADIVLRR